MAAKNHRNLFRSQPILRHTHTTKTQKHVDGYTACNAIIKGNSVNQHLLKNVRLSWILFQESAAAHTFAPTPMTLCRKHIAAAATSPSDMANSKWGENS